MADEDRERFEEYLRTKDLENATGIPQATWRYWRHKKVGPKSARLNGLVVYRRSDVQAWIDEQFEANAAS